MCAGDDRSELPGVRAIISHPHMNDCWKKGQPDHTLHGALHWFGNSDDFSASSHSGPCFSTTGLLTRCHIFHQGHVCLTHTVVRVHIAFVQREDSC